MCLNIMTGNMYSEKQKGSSRCTMDKALGRNTSVRQSACVFNTKAILPSKVSLLKQAIVASYFSESGGYHHTVLKTSTHGKIENCILGNEENCGYLNQNKTIGMQSFEGLASSFLHSKTLLCLQVTEGSSKCPRYLCNCYLPLNAAFHLCVCVAGFSLTQP